MKLRFVVVASLSTVPAVVVALTSGSNANNYYKSAASVVNPQYDTSFSYHSNDNYILDNDYSQSILGKRSPPIPSSSNHDDHNRNFHNNDNREFHNNNNFNNNNNRNMDHQSQNIFNNAPQNEHDTRFSHGSTGNHNRMNSHDHSRTSTTHQPLYMDFYNDVVTGDMGHHNARSSSLSEANNDHHNINPQYDSSFLYSRNNNHDGTAPVPGSQQQQQQQRQHHYRESMNHNNNNNLSQNQNNRNPQYANRKRSPVGDIDWSNDDSYNNHYHNDDYAPRGDRYNDYDHHDDRYGNHNSNNNNHDRGYYNDNDHSPDDDNHYHRYNDDHHHADNLPNDRRRHYNNYDNRGTPTPMHRRAAQHPSSFSSSHQNNNNNIVNPQYDTSFNYQRTNLEDNDFATAPNDSNNYGVYHDGHYYRNNEYDDVMNNERERKIRQNGMSQNIFNNLEAGRRMKKQPLHRSSSAPNTFNL